MKLKFRMLVLTIIAATPLVAGLALAARQKVMTDQPLPYASLSEKYRIPVEGGEVTSVAFDPARQKIFYCSNGLDVEVYDLNSRKSRIIFPISVMGLVFSGDARTAVTFNFNSNSPANLQDDTDILFMELPSGRKIAKIKNDYYGDLAVSFDGRVAAVANDNITRLVEVGKGEIARLNMVGKISFSRNNPWVCVAAKGRVLVFDYRQKKTVRSLSLPFEPGAVALDAWAGSDNIEIFVAGTKDHPRIDIFGLQNEARTISTSDYADWILPFPPWYVATGNSSGIKIWHKQKNFMFDYLSNGIDNPTVSGLNSMFVTGDGKWLAAGGCDNIETECTISCTRGLILVYRILSNF